MHIAHAIKSGVATHTTDALITLDYAGRHMRRRVLKTDTGEDFLVELPEARRLHIDDSFILDDGRLIGIIPKNEALLKITHVNLPRLAWHFGNRHVPCQIENDCLLITQDHVLEAMLIGLGATVAKLDMPFTPESGAYSHSHD